MTKYQSVLPVFMQARAEHFDAPANSNPQIRDIFTPEEKEALADFMRPYIRAGIVTSCTYCTGGSVNVFTAHDDHSPNNVLFLIKEMDRDGGVASYVASMPGVLANTQTINFGEALRLLNKGMQDRYDLAAYGAMRKGLALV